MEENMGQGIIKAINQVYATLKTTALANAESIEADIYSYAAIGALLYIFGGLISQIYKNDEINFLPYLRPFIILALLPFGSKFCTALDSFGEGIRNRISGSNYNLATKIENNSKLMQDVIDQKWKRIGNDPALYQKVFGSTMSEDEGWTGIEKSLKIGIAQGSEQFKIAMIEVTQNILVAIMYVAEACLTLLSIAFRLVLRMGFPIVITLAMFPGFTNSLINWFAKYLNFALLPAVAAMYSSISFALLDAYLSNAVTSINQLSDSQLQNPDFLGYAYIALLVLSLVGYLFVPSMTAMIVTVGGVGTVSSGVTQQMRGGARTASNTMARGATNISRRAAAAASVAGAAAVGAAKGGLVGYTFATTPNANQSSSNSSGGWKAGLKVAAATVAGASMGAYKAAKNGGNNVKNNNKA